MARERTITKETTFPVTRDAVLALSDRLGEPDWLRDKRLAAWDLAESMPMPTTNDEPWRRTDLRKVDWETLTNFSSANGHTLADVPAELHRPLIGDQQGGLIVFINGHLVHSEVADTIKQQGVVFTDLSTAWAEHRDLVEEHFMAEAVRPYEGKFAALHAAL